MLTRGRVLGPLLFVASALAFLYFVLPKLLGLHETWNRIQHGNGWWLALAAVLEVCSFFGYVVAVPRRVRAGGESRIDWPASYQITMAGPGGDAPVRRGRGGRDRADRLGAAPLRDGAARRRLPDDRVHWRCSTAST